MKKFLLSVALVLITYTHLFAYLTQGHFRWRNNDGGEKTATWKAPVDSAIKISDLKAIRLRLDIDNAQTSTKTLARSLVYATSVNGPWYAITNNSAINAFNLSGDNGYITNNDSTTQQLVDPAYAFLPGNIVTNETAYSDSIPVGKRREYEWCIKPTPLAKPNTTYYFNSTIGSNPTIFASLTTTGTAFAAGPKALMTNGGFENNLTGWTTATTNNSNATFTITNAPLHVHTGSQALVVNVTNVGTASNSVTLSATPVAVSDTGYYLLRFWALATTQNALLDINLKGATTSNTCHYEIRTRIDTTQNGWVMYQYAFKAPESPVTVQLNFNSACTYYLDDVEIINSVTNPNYNVRMQYDWQNNFDETFGWVSGDNNNPALLPDGRVAWVYNDSFFAPVNPHTNVIPSVALPHNLVVVQKGDTLKSIYSGTAPNPLSLFDPGNGNEFWQSGGIVENGQLKIVLIEVANQSSYAGYTWIGSLNLPDLSVSTLHRLPGIVPTGPNCVFKDSTYDYLYFGASSGPNETHTVVGRVPAGQLDSQTAWQFYAGNNVWTTNFTQAANLVEGTSAGSVIKLGPNSYVMSGVPELSQEADVWFAQTPWGPWVNKTTVYNIPPQESVLPYEGHIYPIGKNGVYTITWSLYPFNNDSGNEQLADKTIYVPDYAQVNLLALSPFTPKKPTDTVVSFNAQGHGRQVTLQWETALTTDINFIVQQSPDSTNWSTIATVAGNGTNSYQTQFNNPPNGTTYYRLELFDEDNVMTLSPVRSYNIAADAVLTSFTAKPGLHDVNIAFSTSSEWFNQDFIIQTSPDSVTWKQLTSVLGAGTTSTPSSYQYVDPTTVSGIIYYRIQYYSHGSLVYSPVQTADTRPSMTLSSGSATKQGNSVLLNLTTSSETNNPGFTLQRSQDGTTWQNLATSPGNGTTTSTESYTYTDSSPFIGVNYYRINYYSKGVQINSAVVSVDMAQANNSLVLSVYPNPGASNVNFTLKGYQGKTFTATLTSLYGKQLGAKTFSVSEDQTYTLATNAVAGVYILYINGENLNQTSRVLVQ